MKSTNVARHKPLKPLPYTDWLFAQAGTEGELGDFAIQMLRNHTIPFGINQKEFVAILLKQGYTDKDLNHDRVIFFNYRVYLNEILRSSRGED